MNCICNLVPSRTGIKFEPTPEPYPDKQNPPHYCSLKDTPREGGTLNDFNHKVQIKKWIKDGGNISRVIINVSDFSDRKKKLIMIFLHWKK